MNLEVISEVCLPQEDTVTVPMGTAELLGVLVRVCMSYQLVMAVKTPVAALWREGGREGGKVRVSYMLYILHATLSDYYNLTSIYGTLVHTLPQQLNFNHLITNQIIINYLYNALERLVRSMQFDVCVQLGFGGELLRAMWTVMPAEGKKAINNIYINESQLVATI